jgi:hypothetical protein
VYDKRMDELQTVDLRVIKKPNKKQRRFLEYWLLPENIDTFGNAYKSAIKAGFSENSARVITGNARGLGWIREAKQLFAHLEPEHIYTALQNKALHAKSDRDQIRALELMAKIRGMFIERSQSEVNVTFTNNVPRPKIVDVTTENHNE